MIPAEPFLSGRVAVVTGGTSGIGRAIARALASVGSRVVVGSRYAEKSDCLGELAASGTQTLAVDVDVRSSDAVRAFHAAVLATFGHVDVLVNAAGVCHDQMLSEHSDEMWEEVVDVNLNGVYRMTKTCLPGMIERRWGRIINIASDISTGGVAHYAAYCASKAGVLALTRCAAREGASYGVSCNAISPGWVETSMARDAMERAARREGISVPVYVELVKEANPQHRTITPEEIAALAVYLCSDAARGITMQDVVVSGGTVW
jgi:3-hydroxybutyrate dehydrogenase